MRSSRDSEVSVSWYGTFLTMTSVSQSRILSEVLWTRPLHPHVRYSTPLFPGPLFVTAVLCGRYRKGRYMAVTFAILIKVSANES